VKRRAFVAGLTAVAATRKVLAAAGVDKCRVGICAYSCHQHWNAVQANLPCAKFHDAFGFYEYARSLGAEGVQNPLRTTDPAIARKLRAKVEEDGGYYEGDVKLPKTESDLAAFEADVRLAREAGATIARSVFMGTRRYEVFKTMDEFRAFHALAEKSLSLAEPIISKHRLKLALENHKDHTADELAGMMRRVSSEWIGVLVDVGNNVALLEKPEETVETLAPFALSVHLKDMAVQVADDGFLLSEVPLGTGISDLMRIIATLRKAKPDIVFNLEMITRNPLHVPCLGENYFATFPERKAARLEPMMQWVRTHPPAASPPSIEGKVPSQIVLEEERNNRDSLAWMNQHLRA
jgi:sugar phosphate isomerase/epimerase